jgi:hypothetical protein
LPLADTDSRAMAAAVNQRVIALERASNSNLDRRVIARIQMLEPLEMQANETAYSVCARMRAENYVTVCLGGIAGELLYVLSRRTHFQRVQGDAIVYWKFWRRAMSCEDSQVDRAFAITFALLTKCDAADAECTLWRLMRRAVKLLRQSRQREQLNRLARRLREDGHLTGAQVLETLNAVH